MTPGITPCDALLGLASGRRVGLALRPVGFGGTKYPAIPQVGLVFTFPPGGKEASPRMVRYHLVAVNGGAHQGLTALLAANAPGDDSNFYLAAATIIPVFFLALTLQERSVLGATEGVMRKLLAPTR